MKNYIDDELAFSTAFVLILFLLAVTIFIFHGCTFAEINIVQRAVVEDGQGLSSTSVDHNLEEETSKMELIVPLK